MERINKTDRPQNPGEETQEQEDAELTLIDQDTFYDLLMEQQEQM